PNSSSPKLPMYLARKPRRRHATSAVAICPPGSRANRCTRCLLLEVGYSATTAMRSTLFEPRPTRSNGCSPCEGTVNGIRTGLHRSTAPVQRRVAREFDLMASIPGRYSSHSAILARAWRAVVYTAEGIGLQPDGRGRYSAG